MQIFRGPKFFFCVKIKLSFAVTHYQRPIHVVILSVTTSQVGQRTLAEQIVAVYNFLTGLFVSLHFLAHLDYVIPVYPN